MNIGRQHHASVCLPDGKIITFGGSIRPRSSWDGSMDMGYASNTYEIFDPASKLFTMGDSRMLVGKTNVSACLMKNGRIFIIGTNASGSVCFEEYDSGTDSFHNSTVFHNRLFHQHVWTISMERCF